jgi:DNA invertase Pin-like site-specific DNA recombinase
MSAPTPCVIYAAKSTQDKHKSIPTQLDDCRAMAEREGWLVVGEFSDEGFSAYSGNRGPGLERAKRAAADAATEARPCMLVAQHSDRFARGAGDRPGAADSLVEIWHAMRRHSVHLRSDQNDPMLGDPLLVAAASKLAYEESERKSKAIRSGKRRRVEERREPNGPVNFGYRFDDPRSKDRRRVPDPDEASGFLRVVGMLHDGKNFADMARWLNAQGFRSKQGNRFAPQRVRDMLGNPYYAGKVKLPDGGLIEGTHEALISWDEHKRICAALDRINGSAGARGGRRPVEVFLLGGGIMRCAHCGRGIWQRRFESGRRDYMCGNVRQASGICEAVPFDAPTVEQAVVEHLGGLFVDLGAWIERVTEQRADERRILEREAADYMTQREALEKDEALVRADYMKQLRAENESAAGIAATELERIEAERADLNGKLADVEARMAEWDDGDSTDAVLDWWSEFSAAIRGEVVNGRSIEDANAALKERFAAIFVRSEQGGTPRLDFVLKDRPPGAPVVSSRLWVDDPDDLPEDGMLVDFLGDEPGESELVKPVGSHSCG